MPLASSEWRTDTVEVLFVLIPLSLGLVTFALWSFIWSVKNEQFEDLDRQGWSILFDDDRNGKAKEKEKEENEEKPPEEKY